MIQELSIAVLKFKNNNVKNDFDLDNIIDINNIPSSLNNLVGKKYYILSNDKTFIIPYLNYNFENIYINNLYYYSNFTVYYYIRH